MRWNPQQYSRFGDHRTRPFHDLVARVGAEDPLTVLDVGCGPGDATATLLGRWPGAQIRGVDSSVDMIEAASGLARPGLGFSVQDAHEVDVSQADVVLSNAMLQWLPDHRELLGQWAASMRPGAWLAFQVPGNFDAPSHALMRTLAESESWSGELGGLLRGAESVADPAEYAGLLLDAGWRVDAWESTYLQWLPGQDPVLEWVRGTALRPILDRLDAEAAARFEAEYAALLRQAYPTRRGPDGEPTTALPFRRVFVVAQRV
ncbi:trans-aconitate 2-methyltransferase [Galactobacter caseinivorans]|uniref:Trans-aconitate 2-methyltransferase n=1 Tax=Galactobacter caseinivorans TaxID=2676123 RepID=A0A496PKJ7_9MICC|nr:trans-aconitate 2-methyltransferase [Galactobacter caseinivorans]RKW71049.1 trans-aconitate 2-methyltransferase [Galactobacter caseinivorans]